MTRKELAEAMLEGVEAPGVMESRGDYVHVYEVYDGQDRPCAACALGCALIGEYGGNYSLAEKAYREIGEANPNRPSLNDIAELLGIDIDLAVKVEDMHFSRKSVRRIAEWLMEGE